MATQTDVQQLIQSLVPSGVNNGNPGTVYNTPVPTVDASGRWTSPTINPAASLPALNLPALSGGASAWLPPTGTGGGVQGPILPTMPPPTTGGGSPTLPPVTPPVVGPPVSLPTPNQPPGSLPVGPGPGSRYPLSGTGSQWGFGPGHLGGGMTGGGGSGSFDWRQLLDVISEPLIPGDLYHSGTQQWDTSNAVLAGLDSLFPGSSWLAQQGGDLTNSDWYHDHILDIAQNQMALNQNEVQNNSNQAVQDDITKTLEKMFGSENKGAGGGNRTRSRGAAGSRVVAEGKAAQDMLASMKHAQYLDFLRHQPRISGLPRNN